MKLHPKPAALLAVLALALVPALAGATSYTPEYHPEHPEHPAHSEAPKGHAYGYYCQGVSKKHVKGQKGTPFSQCVHAMKVADHDGSITAKQACKALKGQKHAVRGDKGTAFSRCIKGVNQMRREEAATVTSSVVA